MELEKFREDWKAELGLSTNENVNKAIDSWLQAQEHERNGEMGRAIGRFLVFYDAKIYMNRVNFQTQSTVVDRIKI